MRAKPLEKDVQKQCLQYLAIVGAYCWRQNQGGMKAEYKGKRRFIRFANVDGISDILGVLPGGRLLACEVKRPGEEPTLKQRIFLAAVQSTGGLACVVHSSLELEQILREEGYGL